MKDAFNRHRILFIGLFAFFYPLAAVLVTNYFRQFFDPFMEITPNRNPLVRPLSIFFAHFFLPIAGFFFLPIKPRRKKIFSALGLSMLYLLAMAPVTLVFKFYTYCKFNPECVMP